MPLLLAWLVACHDPEPAREHGPETGLQTDVGSDRGNTTDVEFDDDAIDHDAIDAERNDAPDERDSDDSRTLDDGVAEADETTTDADAEADTEIDADAAACPVCVGPAACVDGACIDIRSRPCRDHADCGSWLCGPGQYCVDPDLPETTELFTTADVPALPWPEDWTLEISSDVFTPSFAFFYRRPSSPLSLLASVRSPLRQSACTHALDGNVWRRDDDFCGATSTQSAGAVVLDDEETETRVLVGRRLALTSYALDGSTTQQLLEVFGDDDPRRGCTARPIGVLDVDLDGRLDVYAECDPLVEVGDRALAALTFRRTADGAFELVENIAALAPLGRWGHRLAVAVHDVDHDGLLDYFLVNDSYSNPLARNTTLEPGWRLRRCNPTETCEFVVQTALPGSEAWGSFMGAARIHVASRGELILLTDHGPVRAIDIADYEAPDIAASIGLHDGLHEPSARFTFSWSTVVEDLNHDGLEDVVVTQGDPNASSALRGEGAPHPNLAYLQRSDGTFEAFEEPHMQAPDGLQLSRGAIAVDLDYDGLLDLFIARWQRTPLILEEIDRGQPRRCSVRPVPSVVPAAGYGLSSAPFVDGPWTVERMAGQSAIQPPNEFVSTLRAGFARFPSGGVMPFDCGTGAGPEVLVEPTWISASFSDGVLRVAIDPALWPEPITTVTAALEGPRPASTAELASADADTYVTTIENNPGRVMIRINSRWVGVWLTVEDAAP